MNNLEIQDPLFSEAVAAIDAGDVSGLERLLARHGKLACERADCGDNYFRQPYLLWFVADNPIRNDKLPTNIAHIARVIIEAIKRECVKTLKEQVGYALSLVCSGRVARECGVQIELIDVLVEAGASPDGALPPAMAHQEVAAAERLLEHGAKLTLPAAICTGRTEEVKRLGPAASASERQIALALAALYGQAEALAFLINLGVDLNAYSPAGFHAHGTALHHAVSSGSLDAVKVLVNAGAQLNIQDRVHEGTPLDWAEHLEHAEIATYLRDQKSQS